MLRFLFAVPPCAALLLMSCGGGASTPTTVNISPLSISLAANSAVIPADGSTSTTAQITVSRAQGDTSNVTLAVNNAPACLDMTVTNPGSGNSGSVVFSAPNCTPAGTYPLTITAANSATQATATFTLTVAVLVKVGAVSGTLNQAMATSFQPAEWDYQFFQNVPSGVTSLHNLHPAYVRLQPVSEAVPQKADKSWDFSMLDAIVNPVQQAGGNIELQLATAPAWMNDSDGHLLSTHFADFAQYAANVIAYYNNRAGFTDSNGVAHVHTPFQPITYWGVFNEPNYNGISAPQYVTLYNTVAPVMLQAPSQIPIQLVGLELGDQLNETEQGYITAFANNVTAHVDIVATHFYATCDQTSTDAFVMDQISQNSIPELQFLVKQMNASPNPSIAAAPVWITENNIDADYEGAKGMSACFPNRLFVSDTRGTSAFFAAWRPYMYSQAAKAGSQALYHWDFDADQQYGEVDYNSGSTYLSYWVDQTLGNEFGGSGLSMLQTTSTEQSGSDTVEVLAAQDTTGNVTVMLANHAVANASDNNGAGAPRTVILDLSALPAFTSATQTTIDANTSASAGPSPSAITASQKMTVAMSGYGVTFLDLGNGTSHTRKNVAQPHIVQGHLAGGLDDDEDSNVGP